VFERPRKLAMGVTVLAVAAAGVLVAVNLQGDAGSTGPLSGGPASSSDPSTHSAPPGTAWVLHHPAMLVHQGGTLLDVSCADDYHAAAVWQVCSFADDQDQCPGVLTWTSDGWHTSQARRVPDKLSTYALPGGSAVVWLGGGKGLLFRQDGTKQSLTESAHTVSVAPNDRYVNLPSRTGAPPGLLDTVSGLVHPPLTAPGLRYLGDDQWDSGGRLWEYGSAERDWPHTIAWTGDLGRSWSTYSTGAARVLALAVGEGRVAVALGGTSRGQRGTLHALEVTADAGATWQHSPVSRLPGAGGGLSIYQMTVSDQGTLYVGTPAGIWAAPGDWSDFRRVAGPAQADTQVMAAANGVVYAWGGDPRSVEVSTNDGETWLSVTAGS
jgi:hypothetical protein